ncbi:MAG: DUF1499 domain-containing protein [Spirochaetales bacterium]|nr:DUF1499 domain-containing protein [Spirochaetales bacterium]
MKNHTKRTLHISIFILAPWLLQVCQSAIPPGVGQGVIGPCGGKPNCVSTADTRPDFAVLPLDLRGLSPEKACAELIEILRQEKRTRIAKAKASYIHAEFRSATFNFIDDVEFLCAGEGILVRSQSRTGGYDWGVNRKRVESLRLSFAKNQ